MSQSTLIVGALIVAWFFWIVVNGELATYLGIFGLGGGASATISGDQTQGTTQLFGGGNWFNLGNSTINTALNQTANSAISGATNAVTGAASNAITSGFTNLVNGPVGGDFGGGSDAPLTGG